MKSRAENPTTTADNLSQRPPGIIRWNMFTTVDEKGRATSANGRLGRRRRHAGDADDGDAEWDPSGGGGTNQDPRKMSKTSLHVDKQEHKSQRYARTKGLHVVPPSKILHFSLEI